MYEHILFQVKFILSQVEKKMIKKINFEVSTGPRFAKLQVFFFHIFSHCSCDIIIAITGQCSVNV